MATAAVAIIIKREKDLVAHFEQMRATSPATAQSVDSLRVDHDRIFRRLEERAVIRQSPTGMYYLDQPSWTAMNSSRRRIVGIMLLLAAAVLASVLLTEQSRSAAKTAPAGISP